MRHSTGIHYYLNGDQYDGEWEQDKRTSKGRIFLADGGKMTGVFVSDKLEGYLEFEDKAGNFFQCEKEDKNVKQTKKVVNN